MDYFTKKRLVIWGIALLVLMNIAALTTVWFQQRQIPVPPQLDPGPPKAAQRFLRRELDLSKAQMEAFANLQRQHFEEVRAVQEAIRNLKGELFSELSAAQPDTLRMERLAVEIGDRQTELEKTTFRHFLNLKKHCTPEQQEKLHSLFGRLMHRMEPRHQGQGRRGTPGAGPRRLSPEGRR